MPHQALIADVGLEVVRHERTGAWVPAYREVIVTLPRQNGKTALMLAWELERVFMWGTPQRVVYTAQTGQDSRSKMVEDQMPLIRASAFRSKIQRTYQSNANTQIVFKPEKGWHGSSRIVAQATAEGSGHGKTNHLAVVDEFFEDEDDRREQALLPSMITIPTAQLLYTSTAGTQKSVLWHRKVSQGRAAVANGMTSDIAFFEWSADEDADPEDPETWRSCMPAYGDTVDERAVRHAFVSMELPEFKRAFMNVPTSTHGERVFSEELWNSILRNVPLGGSLKLSVDADPDLSVASIAVASDSGVAEVLMHGAGVNWLLDELEAAGKSTQSPVVIDTSGPVGYLAAQLEARRVKVLKFTATDTRHACAETYARISDRKVTVRPNGCDHCGQVPITAAVEGAVKQPVGDGWKWSRKTSTADVSPLMALSLAVGAQAGIGASKPLDPIVAFGN